jgi:hypothetical protein
MVNKNQGNNQTFGLLADMTEKLNQLFVQQSPRNLTCSKANPVNLE